jgi:hypothetical protein
MFKDFLTVLFEKRTTKYRKVTIENALATLTTLIPTLLAINP